MDQRSNGSPAILVVPAVTVLAATVSILLHFGLNSVWSLLAMRFAWAGGSYRSMIPLMYGSSIMITLLVNMAAGYATGALVQRYEVLAAAITGVLAHAAGRCFNYVYILILMRRLGPHAHFRATAGQTIMTVAGFCIAVIAASVGGWIAAMRRSARVKDFPH